MFQDWLCNNKDIQEAYSILKKLGSPRRLEPISHSVLGQYESCNQSLITKPSTKLDYTTIQNEVSNYDDEALKSKNPSALLDKFFKCDRGKKHLNMINFKHKKQSMSNLSILNSKDTQNNNSQAYLSAIGRYVNHKPVLSAKESTEMEWKINCILKRLKSKSYHK